MKRLFFVALSILLLSGSSVFSGTTGKIAGTVTDEETGEPLPGVNVILVGTTKGAATNLNGYYVILNVPPGVYGLRFSLIGRAEYQVKDVRVQIDLTTQIDARMKTVILAGEEVVVFAERSVVKRDVAASQKSVTANQIEALPVTSVSEVLGLQAGITSGLSIRGSGSNEALFMVDGVILRDERSNEPISGIPLSAVQEISVQTGGFDAEYNNVRSGIVNVVTKEGNPNQYAATVTYKIKPPQPKHFGISPYDPDSFWLRPYLDPEVAWTGTRNGAWDEYTQKQYPEWDGWNALSEALLQDDDPSNDLTPQAAQRIFLWQHRKQGDIKDPDYYIDAGFGGPVPFVSKSLGNLRFYASHRREKEMYLMELSRDALIDQSWMLKLTSDISPSMKLSIMGLYGETDATSESTVGGTALMSGTFDVANAINTASFTVPWRIYTNIYWSQTSRYYHTLSAKLTHVLNPRTFYDLQLKRVGRNYSTKPVRNRDPAQIFEILPGYLLDEAPVGFAPNPIFSVEGRLGMGGPVSTSRDFSEVSTYSASFDLVSQINDHNQVKTGVEFVYDNFDMRFGQVNEFLPEGNTWTTIQRKPFRGALYLQDKIEFEGWISSLGMIMEYADPNGDWFEFTDFDRGFASGNFNPEDEETFQTKKTKGVVTFSPRLSVSHPITVNSKLYFNYGHFRQMPTSERLYRVQRDLQDKLDNVGDPTLPLAKTISYELGYDHALFDDYLFHVAAYYKDISDQSFNVRYISFDGKVNYLRLTNNSYEDIRGFEVDISRLYGEWITGNINYEYRVGTSGFFGAALQYENPAEQREYLRRNPIESRPHPQPRLKSNIDLHTPLNFGPEFAGQRVFGGWHLNLITFWTSGQYFTYNPNNVPGIRDNFQYKNFFNSDLKITKVFPFKSLDVKFFVDINNLFNIRYFSGVSFYGLHDYDDYMQSLHLPPEIADPLGYGNIPGEDGPGDYRDDSVEFVPTVWIRSVSAATNPNPDVIYYDAGTQQYMQYVNDQWGEVSSSRINQILDDKAYIDMPNQSYFTFLNPRNVFFGFTFTYRL